MYNADNKNREKQNNGRKGITKSRKHQNTQRKRKLQEFGNIASGHHQTNRMKEKIERSTPEHKKFPKQRSVAKI